MELKNSTINYYAGIVPKFTTAPNFRGGCAVETLTHYNIGMMENGIIGKVRVFRKNGKEAFLNVVKYADKYGNESYLLKDKIGNLIGEIDLKISKFWDYDRINFPQDPSHVFVQFVCNHSNPNTEYYTHGLEEYTGIGTRLMQIAQRRSDEALCNGNIQLNAKRSAKGFHEKMGFKEIPDRSTMPDGNMYLPPDAKEPLSKKLGGL